MADKQISELTAASNLTDSTMFVVEQSGSAMKANWGMMKNYISPGVAQIYSSSSTYAVGDYVLYQDTLYRCTTPITTAETWTAAHWTAAVLGDDVSNLKSAIDTLKTTENISDFSTIKIKNNNAVTNNNDGTYTIGTTDNGTVVFGDQLTLTPGIYTLYGVPNGYSYLSESGTATSYQTAFAKNTTGNPMQVVISEQISCYLGFRNDARPSTSFTITPFLYIDVIREIKDTIAENKTEVESEISALDKKLEQCFIKKSAVGNPLVIKDSATYVLKSLNASDDCTVTISGKNLLSADFDTVTYANRADETITYGKGAYQYAFPSRVTVTKCADNTITLTPTSANVSTTGVGIFVKVKPSTKYVLSYSVSGSGTASVVFYNSSKEYITNDKESAQSGYSFTTGATTEYVYISFRGTSENNSVTFTNMQLEEGETPTAFTPYQKKQTVSVVSGTETDVSNVFSYYPITYIEGTNSATLTVGYYANAGSVIEQTDKVLIKDIQKNAFVSSYNVLDGWEAHAKAFSEMMIDVNETEGFLFFTDTHFMAKQTESEWKEYAYAIFAYMEQLYYASPCSFVLHGGDWLGSGEAKTSAIYKLSTLNGIFRSRFNKFALLVGNHETGNQMQGNTPWTHDTLSATLLANVGKTYYKFDANTFRLYCFDSWTSGAIDSYAKEQIAWFANSLMTETAEHIVITMHILYDEGTLKPLGDELTKCASAYNSRGTYTYDGNTYNFGSASGSGKVGFVIAGHEHGDASGTVNGIPYIMTINTTEYSDTTFSNLPLPVDLVKVDWNTKKLTAYRAARGATGTTREITIIA